MLDAQSFDARRVAVLSSAGGGGGGIAAQRLADALNSSDGFTADFLTGQTLGGFVPSEVAPMMSMSNRRKTDTHYTLEYPGYRRDWMINLLSGYDVVNIHWASYLLTLAELDALATLGTRLIFTLHDFHYITGGCHYPAGCERMMTGCYGCEQVDPSLCDANFVPVNLRIKRGIMAHPNVSITAPSRYLRDKAVASGIIPDDRAYVMRNAYLPEKPKVPSPQDNTVRLLVIADSLTEGRKGMPLAVEVLCELARKLRAEQPGRPVECHIVGSADDRLKALLRDCELPHQLHGRIVQHEYLVDIFEMTDIVLTCSYEDNWPNILVEAGAYGAVPVVGPGHGCEEFARTYGIGKVADGYTADGFVTALLEAMDALPDDASQKKIAARIRTDHDPATIAAAFAAVVDAQPAANMV